MLAHARGLVFSAVPLALGRVLSTLGKHRVPVCLILAGVRASAPLMTQSGRDSVTLFITVTKHLTTPFEGTVRHGREDMVAGV